MKKFVQKLASRKFAVAGAGMAAGFGSENPVMAIIIGAVYIIMEGLVDTFRREVARGGAGNVETAE